LGADGKPALERDPESKASQEVARLFSWFCEQVGLASSSLEDARQQFSKMSQAALKVQLAALALARYAGEGHLAELGPGFRREDRNPRYASARQRRARPADQCRDGMQPSTAFSTNTADHSCPFAEWIVDRMR
jgi:hypothetical protein